MIVPPLFEMVVISVSMFVIASNGISPDSALRMVRPFQRTTRCMASKVKVLRRSKIMAKSASKTAAISPFGWPWLMVR